MGNVMHSSSCFWMVHVLIVRELCALITETQVLQIDLGWFISYVNNPIAWCRFTFQHILSTKPWLDWFISASDIQFSLRNILSLCDIISDITESYRIFIDRKWLHSLFMVVPLYVLLFTSSIYMYLTCYNLVFRQRIWSRFENFEAYLDGCVFTRSTLR